MLSCLNYSVSTVSANIEQILEFCRGSIVNFLMKAEGRSQKLVAPHPSSLIIHPLEYLCPMSRR